MRQQKSLAKMRKIIDTTLSNIKVKDIIPMSNFHAKKESKSTGPE